MKELLVSMDLELNQPSRRIIQIGAVIGNIRTGEIVSRFDSKVSPNEELSPAIVRLTKIEQEEVDAAPNRIYRALLFEFGRGPIAATPAKLSATPGRTWS
jgi:DNA polymerase III alpha subunit (gram-positive type)